jgi:hypothetical protein
MWIYIYGVQAWSISNVLSLGHLHQVPTVRLVLTLVVLRQAQSLPTFLARGTRLRTATTIGDCCYCSV